MPKRKLSYEKFRQLCELAMAAGARPRANGSIQWDISGGCYAPPTFVLTCHNSDQSQHRYVDLTTRCRKCEPCLKARAALWRIRMIAETEAATRTWFVTLTLDPGRQSQALMYAHHRAKARGINWAEMNDGERFAYVHRCISPEITLFVKRVRKTSGANLRLCCVAERHKSGHPHYHALLHDVDPEHKLRHRHIVEAWRWGFSSAKLVEDNDRAKASAYAAKYLTKSSLARVRASRGYGRHDDPLRASCASNVTAGTTTHDEQSVTPNHASDWWVDFIAGLRHHGETC